MASKTDVIDACHSFNAALWPLASDTQFSDAQRARFGQLSYQLGEQTNAFARRPRFGEDSPYYENAKFWAELGSSHMGSVGSMPDYICIIAERCIAALVDVTVIAGGLTRGLRGALLPAAPAPEPVAAVVVDPVGGSGTVAMRRNTIAAATAGGTAVTAPGPVPPKQGVDSAWIEKLLKMFPAEAVTAYTFGSTSLKSNHLLVALVTLAAMLCVRWVALTPESGTRPDWKPLAVSSGSFLLWIAATDLTLSLELCTLFQKLGGTCTPNNLLFQSWAVYLILIWTWVVPVVVKEPQQQ